MNFKQKIYIGLLLSVILIIIGCSEIINPEMKGEKNAIHPPSTKILNVPTPNNPQPLDQLYETVLDVAWSGISNSSLITGFYYKVVSEFMETGEIIEQPEVFTEDKSVQMVFPSRDKVNKQTIRVFALDKEGQKDETGDSLVIYTRQSIAPDTKILFPANNDTLLINRQIDLTWKGFKVVVVDSQPNPFNFANPPVVMDYFYKIDDGEWSTPQPDSAFYIDPAIITGEIEGAHKLYVKARNNAYKADTTAAEIDLYFYLPDENKKEWLIIDDSNEKKFGVTDAKSDQYFFDLFEFMNIDNYMVYDVKENGIIPIHLIRQYKYVLYHSEHISKTNLDQFIPVLTQYLDTGGRLLITSTQILDNIDNDNIKKSMKYYGDFLKDYVHIDSYNYGLPNKMQGLSFSTSNDTVYADIEKINATIGGIKDITRITKLGNFAEPLFQFVTKDSLNLKWNGADIGIGYYNDSYRLVFCGFPLYPFTIEGGAAIIKEVTKYFDEEKPF